MGYPLFSNAIGITERLQQVFITSQDVEQLASGYVDIPPYYASSSPYSPKRTVNLGKQTVDLRRNNQAFQNAPKQGERPLEQRLAHLLPSPQTVDETPQKTIRNRANVSDRMRLEIIRLTKMGMSRRKIKDVLGLHGDKYEIVRQVLDDAGL